MESVNHNSSSSTSTQLPADGIRNTKKYWTHDAISYLIAIMNEGRVLSKFNESPHSHKQIWVDIAEEMTQNGHVYSAAQCSSKFEKLRGTYKEKASDDDRQWPYFDAMAQHSSNKRPRPIDAVVPLHPSLPLAKRAKPAERRWERMEDRLDKNTEFLSTLVDSYAAQVPTLGSILTMMQQRQVLEERKMVLKENDLEQETKESEHRMRMAERRELENAGIYVPVQFVGNSTFELDLD